MWKVLLASAIGVILAVVIVAFLGQKRDLITVVNKSGKPVDITATLTTKGKDSDIVFIITDGNDVEQALDKSKASETVTIPSQS